MSNWPYPNGVTPEPQTDHELIPERDPSASPVCKHCGAGEESLWRDGQKITLEGLVQIVFCKACSRYSWLPHGQRLKAKPPRKIVGLDRPPCPSCGSREVWRRGAPWWICRWCRHTFVPGQNRVRHEHKAVQQWQEVSPRDEAQFLFHYAKRNGRAFSAMRQTIDVSEREKTDWSEFEAELAYRAQVLEQFDKLVAEHLRAVEFIAACGMQPNAESVLDFADRVNATFSRLADAELAAAPDPKAEEIP